MGKLVLIAVIVVASVVAVTMISVNERSQELPETLNVNFKNLGSYALQYAVNQIVEGNVTESGIIEYNGEDEDEFRVLNGQIKQIEYKFTYADVTIGTPGEDDGGDDDDNGGGLNMEGWLNINPGNSTNNQFQMTNSNGTYDRWDLHDLTLYGYNGSATEVKVMPKSQGRYIEINGENIRLSTNTRYTITSDNMSVYIYNTKIKNGKAMGQWWINIVAEDAMIDPVPDGVEIPEEEPDEPEFDSETYSLIQNVEIIADVASYVSGVTHDHTASCYLEADTKVDFDIIEDGTVIVNDRVDVKFTALGSAFSNSYDQVSMQYSMDGGSNFTDLWNGNYIQNGWEFTVEDIDPGSEIVLNSMWYDYYYRRYGSQKSNSSWTLVYRDGDQAPSFVPYSGQASAEEFMADYLSSTGEVTLGENDAIFLFELGHATKDYQDAVMLVTFEKTGDGETVYVGDIDLETDNYKVIYWKP